jgi:stearoyl-CoA desaturase (delta-9 desaturase)
MAATERAHDPLDDLRWLDNIPFWGVHIAAIVGVVMLGFSWAGVAWFAATYFSRMFGITGGYHRYFSHRTYKAGRVVQFFLALLGALSVQKGPLWWAAHHRNHHKFSDEPEDVHSPRQRGFWWSHMGWILVKRHAATHTERVKDLAAFPELRFLERFHMLFVLAFAVGLYLLGGATALVWGFFVSTTLLWHGTFTINSLAHVWGKRRYETTDDSRNNPVLAILTMGEGWHNNHHYYQRSARQGFYWWEVDISFYILKTMELVGLVSDVQGVPKHVRDQTGKRAGAAAEPVLEPEGEPVA